MKIQTLPNKEQLTFFNVQYYNNAKGQGSANHVIRVSYSSHSDPTKAKLKHNQRVVMFNLKDENKAINRLVKNHLGEDHKQAVKSTIKSLKKDKDIITFFGFRRVQYKLKHKFNKGATFHKNTLDVDTCVFMFWNPDNTVDVSFSWGGSTISTRLVFQIDPVPGQSLAYAYWTNAPTEQELIDRIKGMNDVKAKHATNVEGCTGLLEHTESSTTNPNTRTGSGTCIEEGILQSSQGRVASGIRRECEELITASTTTELAGTGRDSETDSMGERHKSASADAKYKKPITAEKALQSKPNRRNNSSDSNQNREGNVVDKFFENPFSADIDRTDKDLGTTFSIRIDF